MMYITRTKFKVCDDRIITFLADAMEKLTPNASFSNKDISSEYQPLDRYDGDLIDILGTVEDWAIRMLHEGSEYALESYIQRHFTGAEFRFRVLVMDGLITVSGLLEYRLTEGPHYSQSPQVECNIIKLPDGQSIPCRV